MLDKFMRCGQVIQMTGLGRSTIYDKMAKSEFPLPVKIGGRSVAWRESSVVMWMDSCQVGEYRNAC